MSLTADEEFFPPRVKRALQTGEMVKMGHKLYVVLPHHREVLSPESVEMFQRLANCMKPASEL